MGVKTLTYHVAKAGIGTYTADGSSINTGFFGGIKRSISQLIDAGFATTFDSHVIAGYRFLMRYYSAGDRIYIFGFSRGAFTARFLARMVSKVGLLSRGNEEMVPFAYKLYQDCEMGKSQSEEYIHNFKHTFCRGEHLSGEGNSMDDDLSVKVHFLGLFDTVNSVGTFDVPFTRKLPITTVGGTAEHVRHAVAIDERRVKFKASLLAQDVRNEHQPVEDIKEVWFSGNHGDIGGGWPAVRPEDSGPPTNARRKARSVVFSQKDRTVSKQVKDDPFQLSDITLKWMIDELDEIGKRNSPSGDQIEWNANKVGFLKHYEEKKNDAMRSHTHDTMKFGGGGSWTSVLFWKMMGKLLTVPQMKPHFTFEHHNSCAFRIPTLYQTLGEYPWRVEIRVVPPQPRWHA